MAYKYTREEWEQIKLRRDEEDRAMQRAYAEDMDVWSALREEQATVDRDGWPKLQSRKGLS